MNLLPIAVSVGLLTACAARTHGQSVPPARSKAEVRTLIEEAGRTKPPWWDEVNMNHPETLDLTWPKPTGKWDPRRHVGQYIVSWVNPQPARWKPAIKLVQTLVEEGKPNTARGMQNAIGQLANMYFRFYADYARAAYWWEVLDTKYGSLWRNQTTGLAECYFRLGNRDMAEQLLRRADMATTKVWSDMGDLKRALAAVDSDLKVRPTAYDALLAGGNACRAHGKYTLANAYYGRVLKLSASGRQATALNRMKAWARQGIAALKIFSACAEQGRYPDGVFEGTGQGYRGEVQVQVEVKGGKLTGVKVLKHRDDWPARAPNAIPAALVQAQGPAGVDAVTGATRTSDAIIAACADALGKGLAKE